MASTGYMMDAAREGDRLERKTDHALTQAQLGWTGLAAGMRAIDVGAGTGAVSRDMAAVVGDKGMVYAYDGSKERLAQGASIAKENGVRNIKFCEGNVYDLRAPDGPLDYAWARFFFEYLERPGDALNRMVDCLRPGGTVVVSDIDGNCNLHYPMPPGLADSLAALERGLRGRFDPYIGRKLYTMMSGHADLQDVRVDVRPYHLIAGAIDDEHFEHWRMKLQNFRSAGELALGQSAFDDFERAFLQHLKDPMSITYSILFTVWAKKKSA